jgi:hypothetical protein
MSHHTATACHKFAQRHSVAEPPANPGRGITADLKRLRRKYPANLKFTLAQRRNVTDQAGE